MALVEVKVPDIGDFKDVEIIELLVKPGDTVRAEQSLLTVESDKASMEIPSSNAGVVKEIKVKLGDKVSEGRLVLVLEAESEAAASDSAQAASAAPANVAAPAPAAPASQAANSAPPSPVGAAPPISAGRVEVLIPDIGDFAEVSVIEVFIKPGDVIQSEQSLITVESDKASMEIPSSHAGIVRDVRIKVGDKVAKGSVVALIDAHGVAAATLAAPAAPVAASASSASAPAATAGAAIGARSAPTAALPLHEPTAPKGNLPHASPTIRKLARELGVPLDELAGTGPKGRITQEDVQSFVKRVMAGTSQTRAQATQAPPAAAGGGALADLIPWPKVDFAKFGAIERKDLSRIKKISGANLHRNWVVIPHVTNHDDADITDLEAFRVQLNKENEKSGVKVTMLAFLIKASVAALQEVSRIQRITRRRATGAQAVLPHRLCGGHAQRLDGAGDQGCRQEGRAADQPGDG